MTTFLILYFLGLAFHGYCAYKEITWCDRNHHRVTLIEHVSGIVRLILWPWIPIEILIDYYTETLNRYAEPQSPDR